MDVLKHRCVIVCVHAVCVCLLMQRMHAALLSSSATVASVLTSRGDAMMNMTVTTVLMKALRSAVSAYCLSLCDSLVFISVAHCVRALFRIITVQ